MLSLSVSPELVQAIARRNLKVIKVRCQVDVLKFPRRPSCDVGREPFRPTGRVQFLGVPVCEGLDHTSRITCHVTLGNGGWPKSQNDLGDHRPQA